MCYDDRTGIYDRGVTDLRGQVAAKKRCKTNTSITPQAYLDKLSQTAEKLLQECGTGDCRLAAIGVGITGLVDKATGSSIKAYGIWDEPVPIAKILGQHFTVPVYVENNVNAFAVAELLYGTGKEHDNLWSSNGVPVLAVPLSSIREIYEGRHAKAAELGHLSLKKKTGNSVNAAERGCLKRKFPMRRFCKRSHLCRGCLW